MLQPKFCQPVTQASDREQLRHWMHQCRQQTLAQFAKIDSLTFCQQAHPDFSPIGWHLGHIAYTEGLWILEHLAGLPPQFPEYRRLFAADTLPKCDRVHLPPFAEVQAYLEAIRTQVFTYLETAPLEQPARLWLWLLQHESQHSETIAIVQALQQEPQGQSGETEMAFQGAIATDMLQIPAGRFEMGNDDGLAMDNERPRHWVALNSYWIDRHPVTCEQYAAFIAAGGYDDACWWSAAGWAWRQSQPVNRPRYWRGEPAGATAPVQGVNWYEAEAYARFVGKRLPTEAEWEYAMRQYEQTAQQPLQVGQVWEWTASWFAGYPGFVAYPYRGYSQAYFDQNHRVLRGGSWATQPWSRRTTFRNWYNPHVREIFAGFRCAAD